MKKSTKTKPTHHRVTHEIVRGKFNREPAKFEFADPKIQAFFDKHGESIGIPGTGMILFEDGAQNDTNGNQPSEPPRDAYERALLICTYWTLKTNIAVAKFEQRKQYLEGIEVNVHDFQLEELKQLRDTAKFMKAKLREAEKEVELETPAHITARERDEAEGYSESAKFRSSVESIRL